MLKALEETKNCSDKIMSLALQFDKELKDKEHSFKKSN